MKTILSQTAKTSRCREGSALISTCIVLLIAASVLATYLMTVQSEYRAVCRSQIWNTSLVISESGVEDALSFMNKYAGDPQMVTKWSTAESAAEDGWTRGIYGIRFWMTRTVPNMGNYTVMIDNSDPAKPVITAAGYAEFNMVSAAPAYMLGAIGISAPASNQIQRQIVVKTTYMPMFAGALTTIEEIDMNGNRGRFNSFDSTIPAASLWNAARGYGTYDPNNQATWRANGNVATDSAVINAVSVGGFEIYGHVDTGPGGSVYVGANGYVGPLPKPANASGIQPGYSGDDMNIIFPDVVLPADANTWSSVSGNTISSDGKYRISGINQSLTITGTNVILYVDGSINLSGSEMLTIGTNTANVTIYLKGDSLTTDGNAGINNLTQRAGALNIFGLTSMKQIKLTGNAEFTGSIYAPQAEFVCGGGGNDNYDFVGAVVARSADMNGSVEFHYDESLKRNGPGLGYVPASWKEFVSTSN